MTKAIPTKRPRKGYCSFALTSTVAAMVLAIGSAAQAELRFANGNDFLPFADENAPAGGGGLATEIVTTAAELLGEDVTYTWMDWIQGRLDTEAGKFDGTLPYFYNGERDEGFFYSDSIYDEVQSIFVGAGVARPESIDDIRGMTICNPDGYAAPDIFVQAFAAGIASQEEDPAESMTRCFEYLDQGRVDAALAPSLQGRNLIEEMGIDTFSVREAPWDIQVNTQSIIFPEIDGAPACRLMARFNGAMAIMRRDGTYDEIVRNHLGDGGNLARLDETYLVELDDGTRLRGQPRSYQRGVFIIDTLDGGQELVPEESLVLLRREGYERFDADNDACRNAEEPQETDISVPVPNLGLSAEPELILKGAPALADKIVPTLISAYSNADGKSRGVEQRAGEDGARLYAVENSVRNKPGLFAVAAIDTPRGFREMADGKADLVLADRQATPSEIAMTRNFNGRGVSNAEHILALEAFAVIVHPSNPISYIQGGLKAEDVRSIARGAVTDWSQVGLNLGPIDFAAARGASEVVPVSAAELDTETLISKVASNTTAIGLVPLNAVKDRSDVRLADISVCEAQHQATAFSVKAEEYPFVRRLMAYLPSSSNTHAGPFIDFAKSSAGQAAISEAGAISLALSAQTPEENAMTIAAIGRQIGRAQIAANVGRYSELAGAARRISTTFRFETASDRLDARAIEDARRLARYLRETPEALGKTVLLVGFTDAHGAASTNARLAEKRAASVQRQLALEGFPAAQIMAVGEDLPVACNTSEDGRALNRRVEVWLR